MSKVDATGGRVRFTTLPRLGVPVLAVLILTAGTSARSPQDTDGHLRVIR
jgi:hypothetical protein